MLQRWEKNASSCPGAEARSRNAVATPGGALKSAVGSFVSGRDVWHPLVVERSHGGRISGIDDPS